MIITSIKFYQMPYNYQSNDRFYRKNGEVVLPNPIRILTSDSENEYDEDITTITTKDEFRTHLTYINDTFLTSTMNIKGNVNFNYIEITGERVAGDETTSETSYWFVMTNNINIPNYNKLSLRKDILTSYDLIRNTPNEGVDEPIKLRRKLFNNFVRHEEDNRKIHYLGERNPHIWNNREFDQVLPQEKDIKPISLVSGLTASDKMFRNGSVQFQVLEELKNHTIEMNITTPKFVQKYTGGIAYTNIRRNGEIERRYTVKLSPLFSLLNEILQTSNYQHQGTHLSHMATYNVEYKNEKLDVYSATTLRPVIYNKAKFPIEPNEWFTYTINTDNPTREINPEDRVDEGKFRWWENWYDDMITQDVDKWMEHFNRYIVSGDTYTCPWGHEINLRSANFLTIFKFILTGFVNNLIDNLPGKSGNLKSVDAYTQWAPLNFIVNDDTNVGNIVHNISTTTETDNGDTETVVSVWNFFPNTPFNPIIVPEIEPSQRLTNLNSSEIPITYNEDIMYKLEEGKKVQLFVEISKHLEPYEERSFNQPLGKGVLIELNDDMFRKWEVYKHLTPSLFSQHYDYNYIDIIGNQLPLDNYNLYYHSNLLFKTWYGTGGQNISYYQGDFNYKGEISEPRYAQKFALSEPIEWLIDIGDETLQLRKNQLDARVAETSLAAQRDTNYYKHLTDSKIALANSQVGVDRNINTAKSNLQQAFNEDTKDFGTFANTIVNFAENLKIQPGGLWGDAEYSLADLTGGSEQWNSLREGWRDISGQNQMVEARNQLLQDNTALLNSALGQKTNNANMALQMERNANIARINSNAQSQLNLIQAEIADIKNLPNQNMLGSNVNKFLSIEKGEVSIINESPHIYQQQRMFNFWNKHGITNWRPLSTTSVVKNDNVYNWYNEFSLYDYFEGGEWTKYLNSIGEYNIEIINEFNIIMNNGLRLHHQEPKIYDKLRRLDIVNDIFDINHNAPNWPVEIATPLLDPIYQLTEEQQEERDRLEQELEDARIAREEAYQVLARSERDVVSAEILSSREEALARSEAHSLEIEEQRAIEAQAEQARLDAIEQRRNAHSGYVRTVEDDARAERLEKKRIRDRDAALAEERDEEERVAGCSVINNDIVNITNTIQSMEDDIAEFTSPAGIIGWTTASAGLSAGAVSARSIARNVAWDKVQDLSTIVRVSNSVGAGIPHISQAEVATASASAGTAVALSSSLAALTPLIIAAVVVLGVWGAWKYISDLNVKKRALADAQTRLTELEQQKEDNNC